MPPPKYTLQLLEEAVIKDGATLLESYDSCNATTTIRFICKCGNEGAKKMRSVIDKAGLLCKKCSYQIMVQKVIETSLERYGIPYTANAPEIKAKREATMLQRYGVTHSSQSAEIREKVKAANLQKYGVTCTIHSPAIKEKVKATNLAKYGVEHSFQANEVKEKAKQTLKEKYGVEHSSQIETHKEKVRITSLKKYGVEHPMMSLDVQAARVATNLQKYGASSPRQNATIKEKAKQTCVERYGVSHPMQVKEFKEKARKTTIENNDPTVMRAKSIETSLKRYGVPHTSQSPEIMEKIQKNSKCYKDYTMPSGTIRRVQGYEPFALNDLLKTYTEEQIMTDRKDVPRIEYTINDRNHYYFPDIYIPHENKIIEVKSTWTYACKQDNIHVKKEACEAQGYAFEFFCYDGKGNRIEIT
jgi:hypothetical protein